MRPFRFLATVDGYPRFAELTSLARKAEAAVPHVRGRAHTITGHDGAPKPTQRPHPPIFLGGGGKRLLTLAAREAQIVGLAPRLVQGDPPRVDAWSLTAAATEEKIRLDPRGRRRLLRRTGAQHLPFRRADSSPRSARRGAPPRRPHP